jgi:hypothetical protein
MQLQPATVHDCNQWSGWVLVFFPVAQLDLEALSECSVISASATWTSSPRLANARTKMDLLIFCFFALHSSAKDNIMALPKKLSF